MTIVVEKEESRAQDLTRLCLGLNLTIALIATMVIAIAREPIAAWFKFNHPNMLFVIPLLVWITGSTETLILWKNRNKEYSRISANRMITSLTSTGYKISHPLLNVLSGNGLVWGHLIGTLTGFVHMTWKLPFRLFHTSLRAIRSAANKYRSFPMYSMPAALLNTLAVHMPVFLISIYDGQEAVGHFGNAYKLTYFPLSMLSHALGQVFFERIARLREDLKQAAGISHALLNLMFAIPVIPVMIAFLYGDQLAVWILGPAWAEAGHYMEILILFYFSMFLTSAFSSAFEVYNKVNIQLMYNIVFLIATFLSMYLTYESGGSTAEALFWFAGVGLILRLGILNYFFYLFGRNIILKTIAAIVFVGGCLWLLSQVTG